MPEEILLTRDDRLLVVAPHPDDESVATGGLMQRAGSAGARRRLLYLTEGDRNPWAQRATERRLWIGAAQRRSFAALRREETARALIALGASGVPIDRLALPDQGLTPALLARDRTVERIGGILADERPTVVAFPSMADLHPDHSAAALLVRFALERAAPHVAPRRLGFLVHNPERGLLASVAEVRLTGEEKARKRAAIECHASQLFWRRAWLLSFSAETETYVDPATAGPHPIARTWRTAAGLEIEVRSRPRPRAAGSRTVLLLGREGGLAVRLPVFGSSAAVRDLSDGRRAGRARWAGGPFRGVLTLPGDLVPTGLLVVKLERGLGFFDEAGWRDVTPE